MRFNKPSLIFSANKLPWKDIEELVEEATRKGDPVAKCIKKLKLSVNHITLLLRFA